MSLKAQHWQLRLEELSRKHGIVGASLAIGHGSHTITAVSGVLNIRTGHPVTSESLFQVGSITKVWTATLAMQLVEAGCIELDATAIRYLPSFRVDDDQISANVTIRQLLSHTSGLDGDLFLDTGRGDEALARYVDAMRKLKCVVPPGKLMSYCNSGYNLLGHIIATVTEQTWERRMRERLFQPLGLVAAGTLPEEALLHGAAVGHLQSVTAVTPSVTSQWALPRSAGPAGLIFSTARDQVEFGRMLLNGGETPTGTRVLSAASVNAMLQQQVPIPDRWTLGEHWGLGWILGHWGNQPVYCHDGATLGQNGFLRILPESNLVICLLVNGGRAVRAMYHELFTEIGQALAGVSPLPMPAVRKDLPLNLSRYVGRYSREGMEIDISARDGKLTLTLLPSGVLATATSDTDFRLLPHSEDVMLMCPPDRDSGAPAVFVTLEGKHYLHTGARTMARCGPQ